MIEKTLSILLPTIGRNLLDKTISSVLDQDCLPYEIVVWDNSGLGVAQKQSAYKDHPMIRWCVSDTKLDIINSWNSAVACTAGEYVYILGDDDLLLPGFVSEVMKELNNGAEAIHVPAQIIDSEGNLIEEEKNQLERNTVVPEKEILHEFLNKKMHIYLGSIVFSRRAYEEIGKFKNIIMNALLMDVLFHLELVFYHRKITFLASPVWQYRTLVSDWSGSLKKKEEISLLVSQHFALRDYLRKSRYREYPDALNLFERLTIIASLSRATYRFSRLQCILLLFARGIRLKERYYILRDILYIRRHKIR